MITSAYNSNFSNKGFALVLSLCILVALSLIGTAFVLSALFDRKLSLNFNKAVKAQYLAEAGLARAIAELKYGSEGTSNNVFDTTSESWYSGYSGSALGGQGSYQVAAIDCASQLYINDNNPNLAQILKNLNIALGSPLTDSDCDNIVNNRPYTVKDMIRSVSGMTKAKYEEIAPYITVYGYIDPYVVNPLDTTTPFALQPRSPINVNTAAKPLIQAVLMGIKADHACPVCGGNGYLTAAYAGHYDCSYCDGDGRLNYSGNLEITQTEAALLADQIIATRPFFTYSQLYSTLKTFCNTYTYAPATGASSDADLVMANANPNTGFSWCRNAGWADKLGSIGKYTIPWTGTISYYYQGSHYVTLATSGLTKYTTEFSFNSGGYYEITSTGRYRTTALSAEAVFTLKATVKLFDIYNQTTQQQFEAGTNVDLATYPENRAAGITASSCDGQIMLSRLPHSTPSSSDGSTYFKADYLDKLDADTSGGTGSLLSPSFSGPSKPNVGSVMNFLNQGDLAPDGMLVDYFDTSCPYYLPVGNVSENEGTLEIWFKPRWNSNDSEDYGSRDQDKKMFRFTSGTSIPGYTYPSGVPFATFFFWSDWGYTYFGGIAGGGWYYAADSSHPDPYWYFYGPYWYIFNAYKDLWSAGQWNQLVWAWKNPSDPFDPTKYNSADNPLVLYLNGKKKTSYMWTYHTPYVNDNPNTVMNIGQEDDYWNGRVPELSNAIIGSVRMWPRMLTDNEVKAEYEAGYYKTTGNFTSTTFNAGSNVEWGAITWTEVMPKGTSGEITLNVDSGGGFSGNFNNPVNNNPISAKSTSIAYRASFAAGAAGTPEVEEDRNVIINGDFESGSFSSWSSVGPYFSITTDNPHSGTMSVKDISPGGGSTWWQSIMQYFSVTPGKKYKFSGWYYLPSDGVGWVYMYLGFDYGGGGFGAYAPYPYSYDQWNQIVSDWIVAPDAATRGYARIYCYGGSHAYIDDIEVIEQGGIVTGPLLDTPVLEDITITYMPKTAILKHKRE